MFVCLKTIKRKRGYRGGQRSREGEKGGGGGGEEKRRQGREEEGEEEEEEAEEERRSAGGGGEGTLSSLGKVHLLEKGLVFLD